MANLLTNFFKLVTVAKYQTCNASICSFLHTRNVTKQIHKHKNICETLDLDPVRILTRLW
jgi:hypothetical protein